MNTALPPWLLLYLVFPCPWKSNYNPQNTHCNLIQLGQLCMVEKEPAKAGDTHHKPLLSLAAWQIPTHFALSSIPPFSWILCRHIWSSPLFFFSNWLKKSAMSQKDVTFWFHARYSWRKKSSSVEKHKEWHLEHKIATFESLVLA